MSNDTLKLDEIEQDRQQILNEAAADNGPNWREQFEPGSFGCHELLDRTAFVSDLVQRLVLTHPACALNRDWYALADQATTALCELYQQVGAAHVNEKHETNGDS
jgi:hypothetical protein